MRISDWSSDVCSSDLSALATVVGFPDLVNIFMGTSLNQTGRAVEIVVMTAAVYQTLTAGVGLVNSWYERRVKPVERFNGGSETARPFNPQALRKPSRVERQSVVKGTNEAERVYRSDTRILKKKKTNTP